MYSINRNAWHACLVMAAVLAGILFLSWNDATLLNRELGNETPVHEIQFSQSGLNQHLPIKIHGNPDFSPVNGVTSGSGTESDPWVIENLEFIGDGAGSENWTATIDIANTTDHFVIRGCVIASTIIKRLSIMNVSNGRVENITNTCGGASHIIHVENTQDLVIKGVKSIQLQTGFGIRVDGSQSITIEGSELDHADYAVIRITNSSNVNVTGNSIRGDGIHGHSAVGISCIDSRTVSIKQNQIDDCEIGIEFTNVNASTVQKNTILNSYRGVYFFLSRDDTVEENVLIGNRDNVSFGNCKNCIERENTYYTGYETFLVVLGVSIAAFIITTSVIARTLRKRRGEPKDMDDDEYYPGFAMPARDSFKWAEIKADFTTSFKLLLANLKSFILTGVLAWVLYLATSYLIKIVIWLSPINISKHDITSPGILDMISISSFLISIFVFYAFLNCQVGLSYKIFSSGDMFATTKDAFKYFKKHGFDYAVVTLLMGIGTFTNPITRHIIHDDGGLPPNDAFLNIAWLVVHFILVIVFIQTLPALTDAGKLSVGLSINFQILRMYPRRLITTWSLYFLVFLVPPLIMDMLASTGPLLNEITISISLGVQLFSLLLGPPMMALITNRIYTNLHHGTNPPTISWDDEGTDPVEGRE